MLGSGDDKDDDAGVDVSDEEAVKIFVFCSLSFVFCILYFVFCILYFAFCILYFDVSDEEAVSSNDRPVSMLFTGPVQATTLITVL